MSSSLHAAAGPDDVQAAPLSTPSALLEIEMLTPRHIGEDAPRPAPANWRGCGYRRTWATQNGGRAKGAAAAKERSRMSAG
jgi:hypothetical protein